MTEHRRSRGEVRVGRTASGIAYEVPADGYPDLLLIQDGLLPMVALARFPPYEAFLRRLGTLGRVICFDRRGIGASARAGRDRPFGLADWADDAREVLAATTSVPAIVVALAEGAMTAIALAARHPESVAALVLINATPGPSLGPLALRGEGPRHIEYLRSTLSQGWIADLPGLELVAPSMERDPSFPRWLTDAFREAGDARRFLPVFDLALRSDVRGCLGGVRSPTMVLHRRHDRWFATDHGRLVARAIAGARYVELPGADHAPYIGSSDDLLSAIRWFVADQLPALVVGPQVATDPPDQRLTPRQAEVVRMVRAGLTDHEVALRMGLSPRTVQKHLELAFRRLHVRNRTAAAARFDRGEPT
ncbi:MAG TPA: alpha/beta fold hydrolase [Acidimicrobiales bacterium]|nr:alpha/beta fold hydrolase [Acidimicrobiales bacterium]